MSLDDYLSEDALILRLCRMRLMEASRRAEWESSHQFQPQITRYLPPRRQWNQLRHRAGRGMNPEHVALHSLLTATRKLRPQSSAWADELNQLLSRIRQRALGDGAFAFTAPRMQAVHKKGREYRPLSTFGLEDKLVEGAAARYFRDLLDASMDLGSMAFRATPPPPQLSPSTTTALGRLLANAHQP